MPSPWKDIVAHPYFAGLPDDKKLRIAQNYFSKNFDTNPDFQKKSGEDPEYRDRVWGNFVSKAIPKEKWKASYSIELPELVGDVQGAAAPDIESIEAKPTVEPKPQGPGPTIDTTGILGTDVEGAAPEVSPEAGPQIVKGAGRAVAEGFLLVPRLVTAGLNAGADIAKGASIEEAGKKIEEVLAATSTENISKMSPEEKVFLEAVTLPFTTPEKAVDYLREKFPALEESPGWSTILQSIPEAIMVLAPFRGTIRSAIEPGRLFKMRTVAEWTPEQLRKILTSTDETKLDPVMVDAFKSLSGEEKAAAVKKAGLKLEEVSPSILGRVLGAEGGGTGVNVGRGTTAEPATGAADRGRVLPMVTETPILPELPETDPSVIAMREGLREGQIDIAKIVTDDMKTMFGILERRSKNVPVDVERRGIVSPPAEPAPPPPPPTPIAPKPAEGTPSAQFAPEEKPLPPVERMAEGAPAMVRTERGTQVETRYAIVEAGKLVTSHDTILRVNKDYPAELQPRDRTRQASELQVDRIARELAPEFLGDSPKASDGAPIIGPDGIVESGNARTIALKRVYEGDTPNAALYKDWLRDNAERFGLTREQIDGAKQPVLVRLRTSEIDRIRFVQEANEASVAMMSPTERAMADAKSLPIDVLSSLALGETGEIAGASRILASIVSPTEMGAYLMPDGTLNQDGLRRVRNAIFAKAYANPAALEKIAESADPNVKNIATAMLSVAPRFAAMREAIARGDLYPLDIGPDIGSAMAKMSWLREQGKMTVEMYLAQLSPDGRNIFGQQELTPVAMDILSAFDVHKRSSKVIGSILSRYADLVTAEGHPSQISMFGTKTPPTANEIWQRAKAATEQDAGLGKGQGTMFAEREVPAPATAPTEQRPQIGYDEPLKPEQLAFLDDLPVSFVELPELIQLVQAINDGRAPKVAARIRKGVLGYYSPKTKRIVISANLWQDDPITGMTGEERSRKTVAHEIGHLIDDLPDDLIGARGNILGRIATLKKFMSDMIDDAPRSVSEVISDAERKEARKRIAKEARELSENKEEQRQIAKDLYASWIAEEVAKRRVITRDEIVKELKAVSQAWKPFDETTDPRYTKYRYSAPELYADAFSVLINRPELLRSTAPKFHDAFFAYFERKPEVQEAYDDIQNVIRGGKVEEVRQQTVQNMFDATERAWGSKRVKAKMTAADFWELFKREMIDVNSYAIGKVKTAIKRGAKIDAESNPIFLYEEMIYSTAEEKAYLRGPNELFKDLEKAGITYDQASEYVFHKRVILEGRRAQNSFQASLIQLQEGLGPELFQRLVDDVAAYRRKPKRKKDLAELYETLGQAGIGPDQIEAFIRLTEGVTRGRAQMANPGGYTPRTSLEAIQALKKRMGADRFNTLENAVGTYQTFMRGYVVDRLRAASMLTPELQAHIEANPEYVTFAVSSFIQQNYGTGIHAKIFRQSGTLQGIANPLTATLMKDLMLIKAINRKVAAKAIVDFLKAQVPEDVKEAKRAWTGRRMAPLEPYQVGLGPEWGMILYPHNGKIEAYYVPKAVSKAFDRNSREANLVYEAGRLTNWFWREIFVGMNPGFMAFNAIRDLLRLSMNMPGGSLAKMFPYWWRAIAPAKRRGFGLTDDTITAMEQGKMLITIEDRHGLSSEDTQNESLLKQYKMNPEKFNSDIIGAFRKTADWLQALGQVTEGMPKVAAYQYLKSQKKTVTTKTTDPETGEIKVVEEEAPMYSDKEIAHMVRVIAGSPDFLRKGAAYPFYNNIFLFSNAMKEGWRGDIEVMRQRPSEYAYKRLKYNIVPKMLMYGMLLGLAGKKMKEAYEKVSAYDLTNYIVVVLGEMKDGRVVYLRIPQDETGRFIGGLFWKTINGRKASDVMSLADYMAGQAPNLSPSISVPADLLAFYTGKNPYDSFRGRTAIPERVFRAGGQSSVFSPDPSERWAAWQNDKEFIKYLSKEVGGQILYRFDTNDSKRAKTLLDKVLGFPVLGTNILSRFIKISDQGTREMLRNVTGDIRTRKYQASLFIENKIRDQIDAIENPTPGDAGNAYMNLVADKTYRATLDTGQRTPDGKPVYRDPIGQKEFTDLYMKWAFRTGGTPYVQALISAQSKEEKMAILNEFLKRQKGE